MNAALPGTYRLVACPEAPEGARVRCDQTTVRYTAGLVAVLNGANEIAESGMGGAGDPDGSGVAFLSLTEDGRLCYGLVVEGISLQASEAPVHSGVAGVNGPIV